MAFFLAHGEIEALGETLVDKDGGPIRRRLKRPQTYIIHQFCVRPGQLQSLVP